MGVYTYQSEDAFSVAPAKLFKVFALEGHKYLPKIFPDAVKSIELLEGNGGPGSIVKFTFVEGGKVVHEKERFEEIDPVNFKSRFSVIEGEVLGDKLEKISVEAQFLPSPNGGSIYKSVVTGHTKGNAVFTEEDYKAGKAKALGMVKGVEAYLQANPDA